MGWLFSSNEFCISMFSDIWFFVALFSYQTSVFKVLFVCPNRTFPLIFLHIHRHRGKAVIFSQNHICIRGQSHKARILSQLFWREKKTQTGPDIGTILRKSPALFLGLPWKRICDYTNLFAIKESHFWMIQFLSVVNLPTNHENTYSTPALEININHILPRGRNLLRPLQFLPFPLP